MDEWYQRALKASEPLQEDSYPESCRGDAFEVSKVPSPPPAPSKIPAMTSMASACEAYLDTVERGEVIHVGAGIKDVDDSIDGIAWGEMCVIAARPSHGKSALVLQWLDAAIATGYDSLLISEEMSQIELGKRMTCHISRIHQSVWCPEIVPTLRSDIREHYATKAKLHVVENCNSIDTAELMIERAVLENKVKVVAIDYLQLLGSKSRNRYEEVSDISRRLKWAAKVNNIALIVACQLNREIEGRPDHTPKTSDLRESGQIEQDSDLIIFAVWPHRFDPSLPEEEYHLYIAKRRNGPIKKSKIITTFWPDRQRIGPFVKEDPQ